MGRVGTGVAIVVRVSVIAGLWVAGTWGFSCIEVHPAQAMRSTQINVIKATAIPFWFMVKNGGQDYKNQLVLFNV
jgi:hypothetical protein